MKENYMKLYENIVSGQLMEKETGKPFGFPLSLYFILLFLLLVFLSLQVSLGNRTQAHQISLLLAGTVTCSIFVSLHWWGCVRSQSIVLGSLYHYWSSKISFILPILSFSIYSLAFIFKRNHFSAFLFTLPNFLSPWKNLANYTLFFLP